ncbi:nuclear transport factor 2 family protein [Pseudonocardia sp. ICBG1122]|nr:nuclear transport factor 2 family protein [Pseudonocardia pini]
MSGGDRTADRQAIADLQSLYCERLDEYDIDAVAALFTPDCTTDYGPGRGGEVRGRDAVRDRIAAGQAGFRHTHHQLGQSRIVFTSDDRADGVTLVTATHEERDGQVWRAHLRYVDELCALDGVWLLASRRVHAAVVEGGPDIAWNRVHRLAAPAPGAASHRSADSS